MNLIRKLRVFLKSRELFRNWFSAGLKYYLSRYGLDIKYINIKCYNGREYILTRHLYSDVVNAYYDDLINGMECNNLMYLILNIGNNKLRLHINSAVFLYDIVHENLNGGAYDDIDVGGGGTIVDVGAGVGDTAILFSLRGAGRVIALEPYPRLYGEAFLRTEPSSTSNSLINVLNVYILTLTSQRPPGLKTEYPSPLLRSAQTSPSKAPRPAFTRTTLSARPLAFMLSNDCEGCEYEAVLNADPSDFAVFGQVIIEYHDGYREIKKHLEAAGFSTEVKPIRSAAIPMERQGYVVARRR